MTSSLSSRRDKKKAMWKCAYENNFPDRQKARKETTKQPGFLFPIVCQCAAHAALLKNSEIRKTFVWSFNTPAKSSFLWSGSVAQPFGCKVMPPYTIPITSSHTRVRSVALWGHQQGKGRFKDLPAWPCCLFQLPRPKTLTSARKSICALGSSVVFRAFCTHSHLRGGLTSHNLTGSEETQSFPVT